jgi:PKD repeat protein
VNGLQPGGTYYFAARACELGGANCSDFSNEVSTIISYAAPVAQFTASPQSGIAPLTVTFSSNSQGEISSHFWSFGDGGASSGTQAVHTYTLPGIYTVSLLVSGPGGEDEEKKAAFIEVKLPTPTPPSAPTADFTGDMLAGPAPLTVNFENLSAGQVDSSSWSFGDGSTSSVISPVHTYDNAGIYSVTLTVTNSAGTDTLTRSGYVHVVANDELPMEFGQLKVDDQWQLVNFAKSYGDPIIVAKPLSASEADPAVIRIDRDGPYGFKIRVQEWDYADGAHGDETVSYIVMERGRHQLPDGAMVLADRLQTSATKSFVSQSFSEPFTEVPIILAAVTSVNELDAVDVRLRSITNLGFQVGMREQESNKQQHLAESIDYIALEPSFGLVNGARYEADTMPDKPTHLAQTLIYRTGFSEPPLLLADMQTTAGGDTANLRWRNGNEVSVELWVAEEQSKDTETNHVAESVGYLALEPAAQVPDPAQVCATPCSLWDVAATPGLVTDPDANAVELGVKIRSEADGFITGVRFYKGSQNTGTHVGRLWSNSGQLLAQATFTNESPSGWQEVDFATPVAIQADTVYVVSYHAPAGRYSVDEGYFRTGYSNGPLSALADGENGGNGVYRYGSGGFPTESYRSGNYWVDALFVTQ